MGSSCSLGRQTGSMGWAGTQPHPVLAGSRCPAPAPSAAQEKCPEQPNIPYCSFSSRQEGCFSPSHSSCIPVSPRLFPPRFSTRRLWLVLIAAARPPQQALVSWDHHNLQAQQIRNTTGLLAAGMTDAQRCTGRCPHLARPLPKSNVYKSHQKSQNSHPLASKGPALETMPAPSAAQEYPHTLGSAYRAQQ